MNTPDSHFHKTKNIHHLRTLFSSCLVVGGSPCSGKSTIAERISHEFNISYYKVDDHEKRHLEKANPQEHPTMVTYTQMEWDEIWSRAVTIQVKEEFRFYAEKFTMILEDLLLFDNTNVVILEGAAFLPSLIHAWGVQAQQAIFLIPTKTFQISHYSERPWINSILASCKKPQQAFTNWMERDHRFGQEIIKEAQSYNYQYAIIDDNLNKEVLYKMVKKHFGLI